MCEVPLHAAHARVASNCRQAAEETDMLSALRPVEMAIIAMPFLALAALGVLTVRRLGSRRR